MLTLTASILETVIIKTKKYQGILDFVCTFTKPKSMKKLKKYREEKEYNKSNLFCGHVSDRLGDNIKHFYKYIYPKR